MQILIQYALQFVGVPYKWGGASPLEGLDCSGLVQVILRSAGEDPVGDQTAQALYTAFEKTGRYGVCAPGSLAFFGKDLKHITHVAFCLDGYRMIEAAGGGSTTVDMKTAIKQEAFVKVSLIKSRSDLVAFIKPSYNKIGLI